MKYNSIKKLILVVFFCKGGLLCNAQSTCSVKIKDLSFIRDFSSDNTDTSKVYYKLFFKIDTAALANNTILLFGTDKNSGNVINTQMAVSHQNGKDSLQYLNLTNAITRYTAFMPIQLDKVQFKQIKWLTLYVQDKNGINSTNLYYKVNP